LDLDKKRRYLQQQCRVRDIRHRDVKDGYRMVRGLGRYKLVTALDDSFAAAVGIRRRALALLATIRSLLIKPSAGEAVEGANKQKDCYEGDGDMTNPMHSSFSVADPLERRTMLLDG
jgi:hypothetical protein